MLTDGHSTYTLAYIDADRHIQIQTQQLKEMVTVKEME